MARCRPPVPPDGHPFSPKGADCGTPIGATTAPGLTPSAGREHHDLPDTQGKTVDLTLKWQSFSGMKSVTFKYKSRK